jgi:hypothetical protein
LKRSRRSSKRKPRPNGQDYDSLNTPRARARIARQQAQRLLKQSDSLTKQAKLLLEHAERLESLDAEMAKEGASRDDISPLPLGDNTGSVDDVNTESWSHALKIAHGRAKGAKDALALACVKAGMTQGEMVERVRRELKLTKLPMSGISQARRGGPGGRKIRRDVAEAIQRLTGFAATSRNWRGGIRDVSDSD